jgi:hypothetical protein
MPGIHTARAYQGALSAIEAFSDFLLNILRNPPLNEQNHFPEAEGGKLCCRAGSPAGPAGDAGADTRLGCLN